MAETFAQYLDKWLKLATVQGLNNPLVKMPVKRFRPLQPHEFNEVANGGTWVLGTMSDPISRNLHKNFQTYIRERGEHCAFVCCGSVEMTIAAGVGQQAKTALFPVGLKRATLHSAGDQIKVTVSEDETWRFNPVLAAHLKGFGIQPPPDITENPAQATGWLKAQLGNRASQVKGDCYVGLFSSQQMVIQDRLTHPPLRQALAKNRVIQAKLAGVKITADLTEITDDGLESLGLVLPCDDSQLRVVQLSEVGFSLQVEGPPGTGKSQTIANIISNALYHGHNVLLVCDKKAAIVQVEERLSNCGLKPALLNLHDEDLDKREFLKQATETFPSGQEAWVYPFSELQETRKVLNDRVRFGRAIAHPSLQITKRDALGGLIQLRKELKSVPNIPIANWQALSKERLNKLLGGLAEWSDLAAVLTDSKNIWNRVRVDVFDHNPNTKNELRGLAQKILGQVESLEVAREWAASVGIELPLNCDSHISDVLALVATVLERPACHPKIVGNSNLTAPELRHLQLQWERRERLIAARHPVLLTDIFPPDAEREAKALLAVEKATSWEDLSAREAYHADRVEDIKAHQKRYRQLCDQIGLVYSPLLKTRRAQLQAVLALASVRTTIPRSWWKSDVTPVLAVAEWKAHLQAYATHAKGAPLPMHVIALERVAQTHWNHIEAKAEHGFNLISYCLHFVNDRKCKYALRQVFPSIPVRGFKQWQEVTLHAVAALRTVASLRAAAKAHVVLMQLTSAYLAVAHEGADQSAKCLSHEGVQALEKAAVLVEQTRQRNDCFEIGAAHWQALWETANPSSLAGAESLLSELDTLVLPDEQETDNLEQALAQYAAAGQRIRGFLENFERSHGDRKNSVLAGFTAQKDFAQCQRELQPLGGYLELQPTGQSGPDWKSLENAIAWRDLFERLRAQQKLNVDSGIWLKLRDRLQEHQAVMASAYDELDGLFESPRVGLADYVALAGRVAEIVNELPRHPLWLEKKRWQNKISAFPEIKALWAKVLDGVVGAEQSRQLFCFNLLRLCEPIAKPHGPQLKQTLKEFAQQDEKLASWVIDHLKANLRGVMQAASRDMAASEGQLRHLAGLQRIRGTVRELVNAHLDYLLEAKRCWMMSPTSLANLVDSSIFDEHGIPFDLVIFDEASQIRVPDGLLSMAFGKQVIIVGDKNQLPPTDFFASFANSDADAEGEDFGISESLLDEFSGAFEQDRTQVMLMSHYRSETPDLIRFSNNWFYERRLEMYPPAHIGGVGRRLHYVPDAVYSERAGERNNRAEAKEVIKLIELHVKSYPDKSLGVVTMNRPQMELIEEMLQLETPDQIRAFCADDSRFFLRNLETVQGDEMDRIILSLTYGKNPSGHFSAAVLGPLTKTG